MRFVGCFGWFPLEVHIKCPKWKLLLAKTPLLMQLSLPQKSSHGSMDLFTILSPPSVFKKPHFSHLDTGQLPPVTGRCCEPGEPSSGPLAVVMMMTGLWWQPDVLIKRCKCICTYTIHTHTHKKIWNFLFGSLLGALDSTYLDCENLKLIYDSEVSPPFSVVGTLHQLILAEFQSNSLWRLNRDNSLFKVSS